MVISFVSFWLPLLWSLLAVICWRFKMKEPINHWLICLLIGAISFFYFAYTIVLFIILLVLQSGILFKPKDKKEEENS